eukprot:CAMPEP_0113970716 /NCGR_PEP_ID=MMETSP0011_2-20120614/11481_1 /TAXON_ID=101924 /ORGANISM="Rhodosorus marinus" /LENGTH=579 /DNA_ID=CAMNT_0000985423 /DNA_START=119 /DNA_END=1857 /DNA_ORIENTATION=+ /assembly_acc=CAM_ASM_000156
MAEAKVDAVVIPTNDPHFCEMPPEHFARREFVTGFTGSAGTAVVTTEEALLWTDARYFLQADKELSDQWKLVKDRTPGVPGIHEWLRDNLREGDKVGVDPTLFAIAASERIKSCIQPKNIELVFLSDNLVDKTWTSGRPPLSADPLRIHPMKYAGLKVEDKLSKISESIVAKQATDLLVSKLDDIAWILNLRGSDVPNTPLFVSYLIIRDDATATLFCDQTRITAEVSELLTSSNVSVSAYEDTFPHVSSRVSQGGRFWLDPGSTSVAAFEASSVDGSAPLKAETPIELMKAKKTEVEMAAMKSAYLKDGVNWAKFLCWLEKTLAKGEKPTEVEVSQQLETIRSELEGYIGPSFETIAAAGENGAVIHYRPVPESTSPVTLDNSFLCDAGCQFQEGTTDITRTVHFGEPTSWQKECFTRVLQGHIAIDSSIFPPGTTGHAIDAFARRHLWNHGLDYKHGTGHGVGASLCVHEGPMGISSRTNPVALDKGMVLSNEPGYYEASSPIDKKLVDVSVMSPAECDWLDDYHALIDEKVSPLLNGEPLEWLRLATAPIDRSGLATRCDKKTWPLQDSRQRRSVH